MASADRRPWVILSRREAEALLQALSFLPTRTADMNKAGAQLRQQLAWINGLGADAPSAERAIEREDACP